MNVAAVAEPTRMVSFRMERPLQEAAKAAAKRERRSFSALVHVALEEYLRRRGHRDDPANENAPDEE